MNNEIVIDINPDGIISMIHNDNMAPLLSEGDSVLRRASHVEPCGIQWIADMSPLNGPVLGPFVLRGEALASEAEWIKVHYLESHSHGFDK